MSELQHHGIQGQRWGKRHGPPYPLDRSDYSAAEKKAEGNKASRSSSSKIFDSESITSTSGKTRITKNKTSAVAKLVSRIFPSIAEDQEKFRDYTIRDKDGNKLGDLSVNKDTKDSMNIIWIGIKNKYRGNGYASDVMKTVIESAKKDGFKELTLEVPGISPDALHIYEKFGFKKGKVLSSEDDVWGGLTSMTLKLEDDELKHYGILGMKWGVRRYQNYDGSYTQAGMKRYNKSMENYEQKRTAEKQTKADYKAGKATKLDVNKARNERKASERQLKADYKQLARDKAGDKGKDLYQSGKRIGDNDKAANARRLAIVGGMYATNYFRSKGDIKMTEASGAITSGLFFAHAVLSLKSMNDNRYLRAFYGHSRNPDLTNTSAKGEAVNAEWASKERENLLKGYAMDSVMRRRRK